MAQGVARFREQVALVIGGAQGIGKAIAQRLAREGAEVALADVDCPEMEATLAELSPVGLPGCMLECDVRQSDQVTKMVAQAIAWRGRVDILMYVAGVAPATSFLELSEAVWDDTIDTDLRGGFLVSKALAPHMVKRGSGKLIFMCSTNCVDAEPQLAHYNASKAGLFLLAKTLARELGPFGINSNAVGPGYIQTRLTASVIKGPEFIRKYDLKTGVIPLGRLGTPEDVAGPALFLASSDACYVNGVLLFVDGGQLA